MRKIQVARKNERRTSWGSGAVARLLVLQSQRVDCRRGRRCCVSHQSGESEAGASVFYASERMIALGLASVQCFCKRAMQVHLSITRVEGSSNFPRLYLGYNKPSSRLQHNEFRTKPIPRQDLKHKIHMLTESHFISKNASRLLLYNIYYENEAPQVSVMCTPSCDNGFDRGKEIECKTKLCDERMGETDNNRGMCLCVSLRVRYKEAR